MRKKDILVFSIFLIILIIPNKIYAKSISSDEIIQLKKSINTREREYLNICTQIKIEERNKKLEKIRKEKLKEEKKKEEENKISNNKENTEQPILENEKIITTTDLKNIIDKQIGKPYKWGMAGENSFDCSGLTQYIYRQIGVKLPRTVEEQYKNSSEIKDKQYKTGDLIFFFDSNKKPKHVGIYYDNNIMVHSPKTGLYVEKKQIDFDKCIIKRFI